MIKLLFAVSLLLMIMSAAASAAVVTRIGSGVDPAIEENMITYGRTDGKEIHLYNLATGKDIKIKTTLACYPDIDISSNKLVWCENGKAPRLVIYDIKTGKPTYNIKLAEAWVNPSISNGKIVWSDKGSINLFDISTKSQSVIASGYNPDISGDNIAYEAVDSEGGHYIAIYNIATKTTVTISQTGDLTNPRISGDYVIYTDSGGNLAQYILATGENKVIAEITIPGHSDERELFSYALRGPVVVFAKSHDSMLGLAGIYAYDDGLRKLSFLNATGDNTGSMLDISGDSSSGFNIVSGFVGKADSAKKANGGIYVTQYVSYDTGTGNVYIDTGRDEASIAIFQGSQGVLSKNGRTFEANLPVGKYMVILSGMGNPAVIIQTFELTSEGIFMDFSGNWNE